MGKLPASLKLQRALKAAKKPRAVIGSDWPLKTFQVEPKVLQRFLAVVTKRRLLLKASITEAILMWLIQNDPHIDTALEETKEFKK